MTDKATMDHTPAAQGSWWQTLPGLLTGTAALLTAVGGLLAVLHQQGLFKFGNSASATPATASAPERPVSEHAAETAPAAAASDVGVQAGHYRFELVGLKKAPYAGATPPKQWLYCTLTVTDIGGKADYVDGQTLRLRTPQGAVLNPENSVNLAVYEHASATVEAAFVIAANAPHATLLLGRDGDAVAELGMDLTNVSH